MSVPAVEEIISKHIDKRWKILNTNITNLVPPGENFGGELLKLDITTEEETTKDKNILHVVAKKIPVMEFLQEMFNVQVTFKAEILFYERIVPILQDFQRKNDVHDVIDCFAKFYGSRLNLNGSSVVDRDAVMIMENLVMDGYKNLDRFIGYNLEEAQLVLKNLANLHASVLAIKIKEPEIFKKEIKPLCTNVLSREEEDPFHDIIILIEELLLEDPIVARWVPQVKEVHLKYGSPLYKYEAREPFATFSHGDLWINNIMLQHKNGKPSKVKLVDFQIYNYKSPVLDILNLLMTSVQTEVLEAEFDNLIKYYHSEFILKLQQLGVDTDPFSYQLFEKELKIDAPKACGWMLMFIPFVVFGEKNKELEGIDATDFTNKKARDKFKENLSYAAKQRLFCMIKTFGEKGWLDVI